MSKIILPVAPTMAASLLETMSALDGNKQDRFNVAQSALFSAYSQSLRHGNKTQLTDMLASGSKKVCVRAMRTAVQVVGVLGLHKNVISRADAIDTAVNQALDIFASIACKVAAPKPAVLKTASGKLIAEPLQVADTTPKVEPVRQDVASNVKAMLALIAIGALSAVELASLNAAVLAAQKASKPAKVAA